MRFVVKKVLKRFSFDDSHRESFARRGLMSFVGLAWQGVVRVLTNTLVGRIGGPVALGAVATTISTAQLASLLWPTGAGSAASRYVAAGREEASSVATHLAHRTAQSTSLICAGAFLAWGFNGSRDLAGAAVVAAMTAGYSGYAFTRGLQFGAGQVSRATFWDLLSGAVGLVGVLVSLLLGLRGPSVLVPLAAAYLLYTAANWPHRSYRKPDKLLRRELDAFVAMGMVGTLASTGFLQSSVLVARACAGNIGAGLYAAAMTLATPGAMLASSLTLVLFPTMAATWGRGDKSTFRAQTDEATHLLAFVMVGLFGALALGSDLLVRLIWGEEFQVAIALLPILLCAICINTLSAACVSAITSRSIYGMALSMTSSLAGLACGVATWVVLIPRMGLMGVALGYLAGVTISASIPIGVVWVRDGHLWTWLFFRIFIAISSAALVLTLDRLERFSSSYELLFIPAFLVMWVVLMRPEARRLATRLRRGAGGVDDTALSYGSR